MLFRAIGLAEDVHLCYRKLVLAEKGLYSVNYKLELACGRVYSASGCSIKTMENAELSKPEFINGRYKNPWKTWSSPKLAGLFKFLFLSKNNSQIPSKRELDKTLPIMKPDFQEFNESPEKGIRHMWIGHASSLVQMDGITFLTDPIFSNKCSPVQWMGKDRYRLPPCSVADLPHLDCVVISHNHYDHLDYNTVRDLNNRFGDKLRWYVPQGMKAWMNKTGCQNVVELTWWQEHAHSKESNIKFVSTPAQHWSKRTALDDNKVLWTSWCVLGPKHRFYFAGDTGYCVAFKEIGEKYGPFTLATIPIGAYHPRDFLSPQHVDPSQAVDIHSDIKSENSVGIHWGTFSLSKEFYLEPREKIKEEVEKRGLLPSAFVTVSHGEIRVFGADKE